MIFLLFLLLSVSAGNIIIALFFPYPTVLMSMGLQFLFFFLSLILFLIGIKKRRKIIRSFLVAALHGSALILIVYIFFTITLPNKDKSDTDAVMSAAKGIYKYFTRPEPKPESKPEKYNEKEISEEKNTADNQNKNKIENKKPAPLVEDPF